MYWKERFNLNTGTYDYNSEDYDQPYVDWHGPAA